jgi:hypothetical protein
LNGKDVLIDQEQVDQLLALLEKEIITTDNIDQHLEAWYGGEY